MSAMDLPRTPKSGAASAFLKPLFQKSQDPLERVPQARWASPGIVDWSRLKDFLKRMSKIKSVALRKRRMSHVEGTFDPAGVLGFVRNDFTSVFSPVCGQKYVF